MKKIIALAGSNSIKSINKQLINLVAKDIQGAEVEIIDLNAYPTVMYGIDEEESNGFPESMSELQKKMTTADGYLIASPEHNGSVPAVFKNTIDWLSRMGGKVFQNKPTLFLTTSPGKRGGASTLQYLMQVMPHQGADVVGGYALPSFYDKIKDNAWEVEEDRMQIKALLNALVQKV